MLSICCLEILAGAGLSGVSHTIRAKRKHDEAYLEKHGGNFYYILVLFDFQLMRERISAVSKYFIEGERELMKWQKT